MLVTKYANLTIQWSNLEGASCNVLQILFAILSYNLKQNLRGVATLLNTRV